MRIIYQVGRMDYRAAQQQFVIRDFEGVNYNFDVKSELSSFALKEFLKSQRIDSKVVLIYPVSIVLNEGLVNANFDDDLKNELREIFKNPSNYLKNPSDIIQRIPLEKARDEKIIIHSLGTYLKENPIELDSSYDDIVLEILLDMLKRYLKEEVDVFYIDISSGHNIYISAIIEASRHFAVFSRLVNWLYKEKIPRIYVVFSDPILGSAATSFDIHIQPQIYTAFFSSPITREDVALNNFSFLKNIYEEINNNGKGSSAVLQKQQIRQNRKSLREKLEMFVCIFSAIKNNTPLYIYYQPYHTISDIKEELIKLINHAESCLTQRYLNSPKLDKGAYLKAILSLGFYMGLVNALEEYGVTLFCQNTGLDIKVLKETFEKICDIFTLPMNKIMLGNEISNDSGKIEKFGSSFDWTRLLRILYPEKNLSNCDERNYFAHSGFEGNITDVRFDGENIFVRYKDNCDFGKIASWLKSRV